MAEVLEDKTQLDGTDRSACSGPTYAPEASFVLYAAVDGVLVLLQRVLLSVMVLFGYDIHAPHEHGQLGVLQHIVRFLRNLYHISKMLRKWLSLNYNDGVIPNPPVVPPLAAHMQYRSTPKNADQADAMARLLLKTHSPISKCYSEPPRSYPLGQGGKGKHNAHDNSDFLSHSLSFSSVVNSFLHSFTGYVDDPEKEDADKPMVTPREKMAHDGSDFSVAIDQREDAQKSNAKLPSSIVEEKSNESESDEDQSTSSSSSSEDDDKDESQKENEVPVEHTEAKGVAVFPEFDLSEEARVEWRQHSIPSLHFDTTAEETGSPLSAIQ
ncbi:hypothetical protein AAVH_03451 [Aphelenchoides avenae]|nr:hypothetical protein AAVH_03451 [Aphelenchus avenae]